MALSLPMSTTPGHTVISRRQADSMREFTTKCTCKTPWMARLKESLEHMARFKEKYPESSMIRVSPMPHDPECTQRQEYSEWLKGLSQPLAKGDSE